MRNCVYADGTVLQFGVDHDCPIANGDADLVDDIDSSETVNVTTSDPSRDWILPAAALGVMFFLGLMTLPSGRRR